jgi:hypothetical protein
MNVNSLTSALGPSSLSSVGSVGSVGSSSASGSVPPPAAGASSASISGPGQFFSAMQQLSQQDPTEFKAVAAQVAASFQSAASQSSGPAAQFLSTLANQFSQAAQSGSLEPPPSSQTPQASAATSSAQAASTSQSAQGPGAAQSAQSTPTSGSVSGHHHHRRHHGGGGALQSGSVQQAFQSALGILQQALQGSSSGASSSGSPST